VRVALVTENLCKAQSRGIAVRPEENMASRLFQDTDLTPEELQLHILSTYMNIRVGIAVIGIAFPFFLWLGTGGPLKPDFGLSGAVDHGIPLSCRIALMSFPLMGSVLRRRGAQDRSVKISQKRHALNVCQSITLLLMSYDSDL
jgi:hypothetical protein